jgi:hypothetical protein
MPALDDPNLAIKRYLAFHTLAFALMGRNVKSVYFNDLLGLANDHERLAKSGELRDLKRTKSGLRQTAEQLNCRSSRMHHIAEGMNHLIALVDADPALGVRGDEALAALSAGDSPPKSVILVFNRCCRWSLAVINIDQHRMQILVDPKVFGLCGELPCVDNISGRKLHLSAGRKTRLTLEPFQRLWLTRQQIAIPAKALAGKKPHR